MAYVFAAPGQAVVPVLGTTDLLPVHRVYCIGRNYAEHAREMGQEGDDEPFFFAKPADAVFWVPPERTGRLTYPSCTSQLHHEVELVVAIGTRGHDIPVERAASFVWGYAVGLDLTRRDLQARLKEQARPWEIAKSFDRSAPISPIRPVASGGLLRQAHIWLDVNGERRQDSDISDMAWTVEEIIAHLSRYFRLEPGDLLFTGTPAGVGALVPGDRVSAGIDGVGSLALEVIAAPSGA